MCELWQTNFVPQVPEAFQSLIDKVDRAMKFAIEVEEKIPLDTVTNFEEVRIAIIIQFLMRERHDFMTRMMSMELVKPEETGCTLVHRTTLFQLHKRSLLKHVYMNTCSKSTNRVKQKHHPGYKYNKVIYFYSANSTIQQLLYTLYLHIVIDIDK